jgi:hypothetical protein
MDDDDTGSWEKKYLYYIGDGDGKMLGRWWSANANFFSTLNDFQIYFLSLFLWLNVILDEKP